MRAAAVRAAMPSEAETIPPVDARVLLAGAFGQGNPGDEALLDAFVAALPGAQLQATSAEPDDTAARHGIEAVQRSDAYALSGALRRSDAVVIAGGTLFKTLHPASGRAPHALLASAAALATAARTLGRPLALVGVGAGSLPTPRARALARRLVRAADLLVLRDEESADVLAAAGAPVPLRVGGDAAWTTLAGAPGDVAGVGGDAAWTTLTGAPGDVADAGANGELLVALSHLAGLDDLGPRVAGALEPAARAGVPIRLWPWQDAPGHRGDAALAGVVAGRLHAADPSADVAVLPPPRSLRAARDRMAGARLVVAQRFHAVLSAATAGAPVLAWRHEPKLDAAARRLDQPSVAADAASGELAAAIGDALADPRPAPAAAVARERDAARAGFRLLRVLLARGRTPEADVVDGLRLRPEGWR